MAIPRSRSMNRGRKDSPVTGGSYDDPISGKRSRGSSGSEHDYSRDNRTGDSHNAAMGGYKGKDGGVAGAGQLDYGTHGNPGPAARRYSGMGKGQFPSRATPSSDVGKMDVYKEGNPPPKGYKYPAPVGKAGTGRIGRSKASSTY